MYKKITEMIYLMSDRISQVLFMIDRKFTAEEASTFNLFKDSIFESSISEYITIVRIKFSNFKNEGKCQKDEENLCKRNEIISKLCKNIVYVNNLPINISVTDDDDDK